MGNAVLREEAERPIQPCVTPPLPAKTVTLAGPHQMVPNLLLDPGPATLKVNGRKRQFFDYVARGVPDGPDDGTLAPWAVVASIPFAPEIVLPTVRFFIEGVHLENPASFGFAATFNPTYPVKRRNEYGWISPWKYGLNEGPIVIMIENYRTGLVWRLMR